MGLSGIMSILSQYRNASVSAPPSNVEEHYDQVARSAPSSDIAGAVTQAFRSEQTPPFGDMLKTLFSNSNGQQRAGILNQLLSAVGPTVLGSGALGSLSGLLRGGQMRVTPDQADQVSPDDVKQLAEHAEKQQPSIVEEAGRFYSQHPTLVKALGAGSLALIMSHLSRR